MKILIADDHKVIRLGIIQLLQEEMPGALIDEASSGTEAIQKTSEQHWDLIILDRSMPGSNGIEVLKQLRAKHDQTPVLIMSFDEDQPYIDKAIEAGANAYIKKIKIADELPSYLQLIKTEQI